MKFEGSYLALDFGAGGCQCFAHGVRKRFRGDGAVEFARDVVFGWVHTDVTLRSKKLGQLRAQKKSFLTYQTALKQPGLV